MACIRSALGALAVAGWLWSAGPAVQAAPPRASQVPVDFAGVPAAVDARELAAWIVGSRDHRGRPFAIVDKKAARLYVFTPQAKLAGASAVLLGLAVGD